MSSTQIRFTLFPAFYFKLYTFPYPLWNDGNNENTHNTASITVPLHTHLVWKKRIQRNHLAWLNQANFLYPSAIPLFLFVPVCDNVWNSMSEFFLLSEISTTMSLFPLQNQNTRRCPTVWISTSSRMNPPDIFMLYWISIIWFRFLITVLLS